MRRRLVQFAVVALVIGSSVLLLRPTPTQAASPGVPAAIFIAGDVTNMVDVFDRFGSKIDRWDGAFTENDGFATGDVDGDGSDEILVGGDETNIIDIFDQAGLRPFPPFNGAFTENDGFATGDLDGDGIDEILVAGDSTNIIDIFDRTGARPFPPFNGAFTDNDGFATGDLDGDGIDEILVAGDSTNIIDIFDRTGARPFPPFNGAFTEHDGFAIPRHGYADADGDHLLDRWETAGVDTDNDGIVDVNLPALGANPNRKDLYVEMDCLVSDGNGNGSLSDLVDHSHCPIQAGISSVVQSFADAPTPNPDGTTGIQLHVDTGPLNGVGTVITRPSADGDGVAGTFGDLGGGGNQIPEAGNLVVDWSGSGTSFYSLKVQFFSAKRAKVFRYSLFVHQTNARFPTNDCTSGWAEDAPGNDFLVSLGGRGDLDGNGTTDIPCWGSGAANTIDDDGDGAVDEDPGNNVDDDGDCAGDTDGDGNL